MSVPMMNMFADLVARGLHKKSVNCPSKWAEEHRVLGAPIPGKWSFKHHPWLREMHDSKADSNVGQKSAQMGYSETMLNLTFYNIDVLRRDCLYVLPAKTPDATDFSSGRFGPALELSPYLAKMFNDVQNIGHKRAGSVNLYIRGSRSRSGLKSIPAGFLVLDELDEMEKSSIPLAMERQSGQIDRQDWKISTPTQEGEGINAYFKQSTQEEFFFRCPSCDKLINLDFPDSLIVIGDDPNDPDIEKSHLICRECKVPLEHKDKINFLQSGIWVPKVSGTRTSVRGFYINQLYSPAVRPGAIAAQYLKSLTDQADEQEFFNSKMGKPHVVKGARITEDDINQCLGGHMQHLDGPYPYRGQRLITMGVDVGKWNHVVIIEWTFPKSKNSQDNPYTDPNGKAVARVIAMHKVASFDELSQLIQKYGVVYTVIDAMPEKRMSYQFVMRHYGRAKMCYYANGITSRQCVPSPDQDQSINVDRTSWLDMTMGRFHRGKAGLVLPKDIDLEYRAHMKAQVKIYSKDKQGNATAKYETGTNKEDHYGHAQNYAEIALPLALGTGQAQDVSVNL